MNKEQAFLSGIDVLLAQGDALLAGRRFGLIAHPASVDATGCPSAVRLRQRYGDGLAALFSPEHGFFGIAGAGDHVASIRHPSWGIPVHSLYGKTRRPSRDMLKGLDALVFDLQDLSVRCYTYVSTLRYVMEEAARHRMRLIVTDRANPLAGIFDGPMLEPRFESFVGCFPGPMVYGLTSGEAALHMKNSLNLRIDLDVVPLKGYRRGDLYEGRRWVAPSPAIRSPHIAWCYPVTVGFEAIPAMDCGRRSLMPFELIGAPGLDEVEFCDRLNNASLPGMAFHPVVYEHDGKILRGARMAVMNPAVYRPAAAAVAVLCHLQQMLGEKRLWRTKGSRPGWFDRLFGADSVRRAIQAGTSWQKIAAGWKIGAWKRQVKKSLLYPLRQAGHGEASNP